MPTRPSSPDPSGASQADQSNPFAGLGAGLGAGLDFFQDWFKAAGSALPNMQGQAASAGATPGMSAWTMPTLDPAELEKRIQDLKTVQFWLEQNARMVAMTIQGLEVQRMTLLTLKGMNVSMDALRESLKARPDTSPATPPAASAPPSPPPRPAPTPPSWSAANDEGVSGSDDAPATSATTGQSDTPDAINPIRWWDTLTQQFTHLASQAAQSVGDSMGESMDKIKQAQAAATAAAKPAAKASKKPARKTAAKTTKSTKATKAPPRNKPAPT